MNIVLPKSIIAVAVHASSKRLFTQSVITLLGLMFLFSALTERVQAAFSDTSYTCVREFFVSPTGNDSNPGTSASPWKTITGAANKSTITAGDCITVKPGTYAENTMYLNRGGNADTPTGYVVIRSEVPHKAIIKGGYAYSTVVVQANYMIIEGFEVDGTNTTTGHGIECEGEHHVKVLKNISHNNGGSGISCAWGEYFLIEGNITYDNARNDWFSGISIYQARAIGGNTTDTGFRNIVRNNISFGNFQYGGWHTDGNGIIIDDFNGTQSFAGGAGTPYPYKTLVENNLTYHNGGKGIQLAWSNNVTLRNNVAYRNNRDNINDGTWRGELSDMYSAGNVWVNNIGVTDTSINSNNSAIGDQGANSGKAAPETLWINNLTYDLSKPTSNALHVGHDGSTAVVRASDGNILATNPGFVSPGTTRSADFRLQSSSPAVNKGTNTYGLPTNDLRGAARVSGSAVDLGVYELGSSPAPTPTPTPTPEPTPTPTSKFAPGTSVQVNSTVNVRDPYGLTGAIKGAQNAGAIGTVLTVSPASADGYVWVPVNFNSGADGWVAESFLSTYTAPAPTPTPTPTPTPVPTPTPTPTPTPVPTPTGVETVFMDTTAPKVISADDSQAVTVGMKFRSNKPGTVTGIRFYKGPENTGTHKAALWTNRGKKLAEGTFTNETTSGWQTLTFATPVVVSADTTYVVAYHAPNGHYAADSNFFTKAAKQGSLTAPTSNGVYKYGNGLSFPNETYQKTNYWVDVLFVPTAVTAPAPEPTQTPTPTPTPEPTSEPAVAQTFFPNSATPSVAEDSDTNSVTLGMKFKTSKPGTVTGIRFYKGANNTGTHKGALWSSSGAKLAEGTFSGESSSGWQTLTFSSPVSISANTTYTASYLAPVGLYSADTEYFSSSKTSGDITVPASGGVYKYGSSHTFPTDTYQNSNYWVDVIFTASNVTALSATPRVAGISIDAVLATTLEPGITHPAVIELQKILNSDPVTAVALTGSGSVGNESDYYGTMTQRAVEKFQIKYGLVSSGTPETTGFGAVGPKTLAKLREVASI